MNAILRNLSCLVFFLVISGCSTVQPGSGTAQPGIGESRKEFSQTGKASFYADEHENKRTASGEVYQHDLKTAAHKKLPFDSTVKVTNLDNGKSVIVKINDRGPFRKGRIIDLSKSAFNSIGDTSAGLISVKIEVIQ